MKREIVRRIMCYEEVTSLSSRGYGWRRQEVHTITPICGHTRVYRGMSPPTKFLVCKRCAAGEPTIAIAPGPVGFIDANQEIKDPVARALIANMREKCK